MANRHCKEEDTCGYFKQDNKIDSICAQERPIEYGKEHTGDNESYSGNNLLRMKDISDSQVTEKTPIEIEDTIERTRERVKRVEHESVDPLFQSATGDIQDKSESTSELGSMRKRTKERLNYPRYEMINTVLRSEFRGEEEPIDIRTTEIKDKNSFSYGNLEKHEASQGLIDIQNKVTKQSGSFNSLQKLQEDDEATELEINQFRLKSNDRLLLSGCKARTIQLNTDTKEFFFN